MIPGLDLYHANPALPLTTAGEELDDLDDLSDLSDLSVPRVNASHSVLHSIWRYRSGYPES